jgi:hypothetical protein
VSTPSGEGPFRRYGYVPAVDAEHVRVVPNGFIVPWNTEAYLRTQDINDGLAGNWPIFVDAASGECRLTTRDDFRD